MRSAYLKIILFICVTNTLIAASNKLCDLGDSLNTSGYYNEAITEYYRYLFFYPDCESSAEIYSKVGYCFANLGEWNNAINSIDRSINLANDDSLRDGYLIDKAVISISAGDIYTAELILKRLFSSQIQCNVKKRLSMLLFLIDIYNHSWKNALIKFNELTEKQIINSNEIDSVLIEASIAKYKSPIVSSLMSILIPGTGQIYSGRLLPGLNAIALNGALGYLTISNLMNNNYGTGITLFFLLFQRYYTGNIYQAYNMVIENNLIKDKQFEREILFQLSKIYNPDSNK